MVGLDYHQSTLDVHQLLQELKTHSLFKRYLEGGELVEWGAKTIPEGGYHALPKRLHGDGVLIVGDSAGLVNVASLKGIHYAMHSGMFAGRVAFEALKANDFSSGTLFRYDELLKNSYIMNELYQTRNLRSAFKSGLYRGGIKAGLIEATKGVLPRRHPLVRRDAEEPRERIHFAERGGGEGVLSKVDAV